MSNKSNKNNMSSTSNTNITNLEMQSEKYINIDLVYSIFDGIINFLQDKITNEVLVSYQ